MEIRVTIDDKGDMYVSREDLLMYLYRDAVKNDPGKSSYYARPYIKEIITELENLEAVDGPVFTLHSNDLISKEDLKDK